MKTYVALLRGINVVGSNLLPMERLRKLLSACGFANVRTYIQSGNAVFETDGSPAKCLAALESRLAKELKKPITVIVKTPRELAAIIAANPFAKRKGLDVARVSVSFLKTPAAADRLKRLATVESGRDEFRASGNELYLYCPDGYGRSKLASVHERVLAVQATNRNWNTVTKLLELATIDTGKPR